MRRVSWIWLLALFLCAGGRFAIAQHQPENDAEFGPIVRAYLGYLENEQEVVDARESRHEISRAYYLRNLNRIRALRQMAIRIARETENDYLPELEAAAADELVNLFEQPPKPSTLRVGEVYRDTFRFLGTVRTGDTFYVFARLDPYEQAELMSKEKAQEERDNNAASPTTGEVTSRPRRVGTP